MNELETFTLLLRQTGRGDAPRLRVAPHFSSGIVEQAKRERASERARKGDTPIPEEKWGTTRSLSDS